MPETRADTFGMVNPKTEAASVGEGEADSAVITSSSIYLVGGNANEIADADSIAIGTSAAWTTNGGCTATADYAAGPGNAGMHATRLLFGATYSSLAKYAIYSLTPSTVYTFSMYVTPTSSGSMAGATMRSDPVSYDSYTWPTLTFGSWTRISMQVTTDGAGMFAFNSRCAALAVGTSADLLAWGAKVELGASATGSYP